MPRTPLPPGSEPSTAAARLAAFLELLGDPGASTDADVEAHWVTEPPAAPAPVRRKMSAHFAAAIGPFSVLHCETPRPDFAWARLADGRQRTWRVFVQLEPTAPYRIRLGIVGLTPPPGVTLRSARPDDAAALRALERRCPIVAGDVRIMYDRGADYFAGARLAGDPFPIVAERGGEIIALHCMLTHPLRVGDLTFWATYLHHSRVLPEAQGEGLFSAMNAAEVERHAHRSQMFYSYVAVGNEASLRIVPVPSWSVRPERLEIDCRAQAGAGHGRPAQPGDASRIVALVNAAHEGEVLFVPYTVEGLAARVEHEPATYGWSHLQIGDAAVVGVWPAALRVRREAPDGVTESVRGLVLDTGFAAGAEAELIALVRGWCGRLARQGITHLTLFTSPGSPGRDALHRLASRVEPYHFNIGLREPPDVATRGLYVDHLYF